MRSPLDEVVHGRQAGRPQGITPVCSAQSLVIDASVSQVLESGDQLLVAATSDQVDRYGGYPGVRPVGFRDLVHGIAVESGLRLDCAMLGGEHHGPNRWRALPPDEATERACAPVARTRRRVSPGSGPTAASRARASPAGGIRPDEPFPSSEINRVVRGVVLHSPHN